MEKELSKLYKLQITAVSDFSEYKNLIMSQVGALYYKSQAEAL